MNIFNILITPIQKLQKKIKITRIRTNTTNKQDNNTYSNMNIDIIILILVEILLYKWITIVKYVKNISNPRKNKHFKSKSHKEFDKCEHILVSLKDIDIHRVDEAFNLYIIELNKKFDYYLVKCQLILVFNDYQNCPHVPSKLCDNKTMIS